MKKWNGLWQRSARILLYIIAFVLSVIGSIQVYSTRVSGVWELTTNVLNSVVKLYLFAPTAGMEASNPWAYEIATWIAPLSTVLGFFTIFEKYFYQLKLWWKHIHKTDILVIGDLVLAQVFMLQTLAEDKSLAVLYMTKETTILAEKDFLEKRVLKSFL